MLEKDVFLRDVEYSKRRAKLLELRKILTLQPSNSEQLKASDESRFKLFFLEYA